jgi:hypothetical protein
MGDIAGMVIKGNEVADVMAASGLLIKPSMSNWKRRGVTCTREEPHLKRMQEEQCVRIVVLKL